MCFKWSTGRNIYRIGTLWLYLFGCIGTDRHPKVRCPALTCFGSVLMCRETQQTSPHTLVLTGFVVCVLNFVCFWVTALLLFRGFFLRGQNTSGSEEFRTQMWSALCARPSRSTRQVLYLQELNLSSLRTSSWEISSCCVGSLLFLHQSCRD